MRLRSSADRDSVYELKVIATDSAGETASQDVTVRVTNLEETGNDNPVHAAATRWAPSSDGYAWRPRRLHIRPHVAVVKQRRTTVYLGRQFSHLYTCCW